MYCLRVFLGYCSVALIVYPPRPIESFRLDGVLSTLFFWILFCRPYFLPFSANKIFSPAPLLIHRPYCLPLSTDRIFSAGPCNVLCVFLGHCSVTLILIESFRRDRVLAMRLSRLLFSRLFCSIEMCSENRFNVTKISKRAIELIAFFFILLWAKMYHALKAAVTNGILVMNRERPKSSDLPEG